MSEKKNRKCLGQLQIEINYFNFTQALGAITRFDKSL